MERRIESVSGENRLRSVLDDMTEPEKNRRGAFMRENPLIVASIALPFLIVVMFLAATGIPRLFVDAPTHDLVLVTRYPTTNHSIPVSIDIVVIDSQAAAVVRDVSNSSNAPRVFIYESSLGSVREVQIELPANWDGIEAGARFPIPSLSRLTLSATLVAPDGYEYRGIRRRGNGLMFELFGGRRYSGDVTIAKNGAIRRISLPDDLPYWYRDPQFLGWVVEEQ